MRLTAENEPQREAPSAGHVSGTLEIRKRKTEESQLQGRPSGNGHKPGVRAVIPIEDLPPKHWARKPLHKLCLKLNRPKWARKISAAELFDNKVAFYEGMIPLFTNFVQPTGGTFAPKSGGKTVVASFLAALLKLVTNTHVYLVPATSNLDTATLAQYNGVARENATAASMAPVNRLAELDSDEVDVRSIASLERTTSYGVSIIANDIPETLDEREEFGKEQFADLADKVFKLSRFLILDGGNDNISYSTIAIEAMRRCDVPIFCANPAQEVTLELLGKAMRAYRSDRQNHESIGLNEMQERDMFRQGKQIPTNEKVTRSIVCITNVPEGKKPEDYLGFVDDWFKGFIVTIPHDPYITGLNNDQPVSLLPDTIHYKTYEAYLELAFCWLTLAGELMGVKLPEPRFIVKPEASLRVNP